eukprot:1022073-Amphidinium_carterae.1
MSFFKEAQPPAKALKNNKKKQKKKLKKHESLLPSLPRAPPWLRAACPRRHSQGQRQAWSAALAVPVKFCLEVQ